MNTDAKESMSLAEAKEWLFSKIDDGVECPCCGQLAKVYKRKLNSLMAYALVEVHKLTAGTDKWVHVPTCGDLSRLGGDWARLVHWGLIEEKVGQKKDGNPHVGFWRLTHKGVEFVRGNIRVDKYICIFDAQSVERPSIETVSIREALGDAFNYDELMAPLQ